VNVGAGTGSYEPAGRRVVAVEPSAAMIAQRGAAAAPVLRGTAEALPLATGAFAASLAVLTIHHWADWRAGLRELARVCRDRIVIFTWDPASPGFWLRDYLPGLLGDDRKRFPELAAIQEETGQATVLPVAVPHDCADGFMGAYWRRPSAYLDAGARAAISSLAAADAGAGLARLAADVASGEWQRRYAGIAVLDELDLGYRLVIAERATAAV
jgi:SAM-dependent methyltransferase